MVELWAGSKCRAQGFDEQQRENQPDHARRAHGQHSQHHEKAREIGADHDGLAADAIVDHARGGRGQGAGQHLQDYGQADRLGFVASKIEEQMINSQRVKPVAQFADHLGNPEQAIVAVVAEESGVLSHQVCVLRIEG
jgi:hypothetical protein